MIHISDCNKFRKCVIQYVKQKNAGPSEFIPFIRLDEQVSDLVKQKLKIEDCFTGQKRDDTSLAMNAMQEYDWLVQARFEYKGLRVKVPFMHRTEDGWDVYFLLIGLFPHRDRVQYYADTLWVLQGLGISVHNVLIAHLNSEYVRGEELDVDQLFMISDVIYNNNNHPSVSAYQSAMDSVRDLEPLIEQMNSIDENNLPEPKRTIRCTGRNKCKFYDECFQEEKNVPDNSILTLMTSQHRYEMHKAGIERLRDADPEKLEGTRQQYSQIMADRNGGLFFDRLALKSWLSNITYPITCLDFEWERFAIPPYKGMKPYDVLPFEYSLHIMYEDGHTDHKVYLSFRDDRRDMAEHLVKDIPADGTVLAFNAEGAEKMRISEFAEQFDDLSEKLLNINERMEDLELPFEIGTVYHLGMRGLWSLKKIMSLMNDRSYKELDIQEGMSAVFEWRQLDSNEPTENREEIIENLKEYCGMDTYAMTVVYRWLVSLVSDEN